MTMSLYFPYPEPIKVAECLTEADLKRQIKLMRVAEDSENCESREWIGRTRICFEAYAKGNPELAGWWSRHADLVRPEWINPTRCAADQARLFKKAPKKYAQFNDSGDPGASDEA